MVAKEDANDLPVKNQQRWLVYMIQTQSGKLYTGITTNLERRFRQHSGAIKGGARFFHMDPAASIVFQEDSENRSEATRREMKIKKLTRRHKLLLIAAYSKA
ncbi:MAG: putative endonuclease [Gammaproteobacteria bacterium]|jgi:putative endonuclease